MQLSMLTAIEPPSRWMLRDVFARRFFPGRYFAPTYWPQSQGEAPVVPVREGGRYPMRMRRWGKLKQF